VIPGDPPLDVRDKRAYVPSTLTTGASETRLAVEPEKISEGVATLGAMPFAELFPMSLRDPRSTEQALAIRVEGQGIVIVTGCGHPTVERIVARAQAVFGEPIVGVVGGLHYMGYTREQTRPHISSIKELNPQLVALSPHDSSAEAIAAFREAFPGAFRELQVGRAINFGAQAPITQDGE
jgi:7,8-dihydropterin-6-yl-methyl-4-(beta-D-ribofuranosyl)aminobenzene 5'-phosphate synthase